MLDQLHQRPKSHFACSLRSFRLGRPYHRSRRSIAESKVSRTSARKRARMKSGVSEPFSMLCLLMRCCSSSRNDMLSMRKVKESNPQVSPRRGFQDRFVATTLPSSGSPYRKHSLCCQHRRGSRHGPFWQAPSRLSCNGLVVAAGARPPAAGVAVVLPLP